MMMPFHARVTPHPSRWGGPNLVPPLLGIIPKHLLLFVVPVPHALRVDPGGATLPARDLVGRRATPAGVPDPDPGPALALTGPRAIVGALVLLGIVRVTTLTLLGLRVIPCIRKIWPACRPRLMSLLPCFAIPGLPLVHMALALLPLLWILLGITHVLVDVTVRELSTLRSPMMTLQVRLLHAMRPGVAPRSALTPLLLAGLV